MKITTATKPEEKKTGGGKSESPKQIHIKTVELLWINIKRNEAKKNPVDDYNRKHTLMTTCVWHIILFAITAQ